MASASRAIMRRWWRKYLEQLPGVAGSVTTAAILFAAAVVFQPTIQRLLSPEAKTYPILCSADPVSVDADKEQAVAAFFILNRSDKELNPSTLRQALTDALGHDAGANGAEIRLVRNGFDGRFVTAEANQQFNDHKGVLDIAVKDDEIRANIVSIKPHAILEFDVVWSQSPPPPAFTREAKQALPFADRDYEDTCYRG
jgi:hypothetical protein